MESALGILCIQCGCGRRSWVRDSEVGFHSPKLRCQSCGSTEPVIARPADLVIREPLYHPDLSYLRYRVEEWSDDGSQPLAVVALTPNVFIGRAVYAAARQERPDKYIILRERGRVVLDSRREDAAGPALGNRS